MSTNVYLPFGETLSTIPHTAPGCYDGKCVWRWIDGSFFGLLLISRAGWHAKAKVWRKESQVRFQVRCQTECTPFPHTCQSSQAVGDIERENDTVSAHIAGTSRAVALTASPSDDSRNFVACVRRVSTPRF